jgi:hypothetical protein
MNGVPPTSPADLDGSEPAPTPEAELRAPIAYVSCAEST